MRTKLFQAKNLILLECKNLIVLVCVSQVDFLSLTTTVVCLKKYYKILLRNRNVNNNFIILMRL